MELNRRYYRFVVLKVTEKKNSVVRGLTEYFPPNPQLVKIKTQNFRSLKFTIFIVETYQKWQKYRYLKLKST